MVKTFWNRKSNIEFRRMRSSASCGICSASCGICSASCGICSASCGIYFPYQSALRNSASCVEFPVTFPQGAENMFQYSASVRNSAFKFRLMRSIGTNFPHHAEKSPLLIRKLRRILRMTQKNKWNIFRMQHPSSFSFFTV